MIVIDTKYFGGALRAARHSLKMDQVTFARHMGIATDKIMQYERGKDIIPKDILINLFRGGIFVYKK